MLNRLLTKRRRPWPLTARVPIVSGALILVVVIAVSNFLMSTVAHEQELSVRRLAAVYLDGLSTTYGRLLRSYNDLVAALNEREAMAVRLAQREQESVLGRLAATVAHEVPNPLGGM